MVHFRNNPFSQWTIEANYAFSHLAQALGVATMRLLTHNLLQCNKKGVKNGFPLKIRAEMIKVDETEFKKEFIVHMIQKLDWSALCGAVAEMRQAPSAPTIPDLPAKIDDEMQGVRAER